MAVRLPIRVPVEYRGLAPASEFTARDSGEVINAPAKLKFEIELPSGDVELLQISGTQFDKCATSIDWQTLKRGDRLVLEMLAVMQERGSDRDSYFQLTAAEMEAGKGASAAPKGSGL